MADECLGRNPVLARLLGSGEPLGEWKAVAGVRVQVSTPEVPGIVYAGDGQGTVDPLGGQGMTMALLGAELLAPFLIESLTRSPVDSRAIQSAWRRRFDRRVTLCRAFHHMLVHPSVIDLASGLGSVASRALAACYRQTRDRDWATA